MAGPFDDTLKHLTELSPEDWVIRGGWRAAPATLIDADIATISGAADKVIRVVGSPDWLLSVEFQAGHDKVEKLPDLLLYNSALFKSHHLPVRTLLVLLHRGADSPQVTGLYERGFPGEAFDVALRYQTVRVWEVPAENWLSGGLGLLPLAPLGDVPPRKLPAIIAGMKQRLAHAVSPSEAKSFWAATFILMGLRYEQALITSLLREVVNMKESVTYRAMYEEAEAEGKAKWMAEEARNILLMLGRDQWGEPPPEAQTTVDGLTDVDKLNELIVQVRHAAGWQQLLELPSPRRRSPRRKPSA